MLSFSSGQSLPTLQLLIVHDDTKREFDYVAGAEKALQTAQTSGWIIVSMQRD